MTLLQAFEQTAANVAGGTDNQDTGWSHSLVHASMMTHAADNCAGAVTVDGSGMFDAVWADPSEEWSDGQVEGQVNRWHISSRVTLPARWAERLGFGDNATDSTRQAVTEGRDERQRQRREAGPRHR
jgi:hypothetical protein